MPGRWLGAPAARRASCQGLAPLARAAAPRARAPPPGCRARRAVIAAAGSSSRALLAWATCALLLAAVALARPPASCSGPRRERGRRAGASPAPAASFVTSALAFLSAALCALEKGRALARARLGRAKPGSRRLGSPPRLAARRAPWLSPLARRQARSEEQVPALAVEACSPPPARAPGALPWGAALASEAGLGGGLLGPEARLAEAKLADKTRAPWRLPSSKAPRRARPPRRGAAARSRQRVARSALGPASAPLQARRVDALQRLDEGCRAIAQGSGWARRGALGARQAESEPFRGRPGARE